MAKNEITRKVALEHAIAHCDDAAIAEVLNKMLVQVTKPRKKSDAPTKAQIINDGLVATCVEQFNAHGNEGFTTKWIQEHVNGIMSAQKATAVMRHGMAAGLIERIQNGKNIIFKAI